jgi:hypothetical protein
MDEPDFFEVMRLRACVLAETGRYADWPEIVAALRRDGAYHPLLIDRIGADPEFVTRVNLRCRLGRGRNA